MGRLQGSSSTDDIFVPLLDREVKKITSFYELQERDALSELEMLEEMVKEQEELGPVAETRFLDDEYDDDDDDDEEVEGDSPIRNRTTSGRSRRRRRISSILSKSHTVPTQGSFLFLLTSKSLKVRQVQAARRLLRRRLLSATEGASRVMKISRRRWNPFTISPRAPKARPSPR
jgi:hypothetical protein